MPASSPTVDRGRSFARRVFLGAGIYGLVVLAPQYFLEEQIGHDYPPPITHPEHFYGFVGLALVLATGLPASSPGTPALRPLMPIAMAEKAAFADPDVRCCSPRDGLPQRRRL